MEPPFELRNQRKGFIYSNFYEVHPNEEMDEPVIELRMVHGGRMGGYTRLELTPEQAIELATELIFYGKSYSD